MSIPKKLEAIAKSQPQIYAAGYVAGLSGDAVLYTEQTLNEEEKAQARENIGAVGATDYATENKAGVVRLGEGLTKIIYEDEDYNPLDIGEVCIDPASRSDIEWKRGFKPITPLYVDYAVKKALTNPKDDAYPWKDEDRAKARKTLGAVSLEEVLDALPIYNGEVESV